MIIILAMFLRFQKKVETGVNNHAKVDIIATHHATEGQRQLLYNQTGSS